MHKYYDGEKKIKLNQFLRNNQKRKMFIEIKLKIINPEKKITQSQH